MAATKSAVSALVLALGFRAISDDDFARVVIAQTFCAAPKFDPSGTSWLPFPFWLQGSLMLLVGRSLEVARASAFVLGVGSAVLVYVAARWLDGGRRAAFIAALLSSALPYAAWLGVATVPDGPTAALILLGAAATSSSQKSGRRLVGSAALAVGCLSRYEAWPVAFAFAALTAKDAVKNRSAALGAATFIAIVGPIGWMLHGALNHGDPTFFVSRVAAYHRAVGASPTSMVTALLHYPLAVLRCEPETVALCAVGVLASLRLGLGAGLGRYRRLALVLGTMVAFLVVGDLHNTAPTHHDERTLLAVWLACAVVAGERFEQLWRRGTLRQRLWVGGVAALAVMMAASIVRPWYARRDAFIDRSLEVDIGRKAARSGAAQTGRLMVDTADFGFYAVIAGFAHPERAEPFDPRDPRQPPRPDAFSSVAQLRARLKAAGATHFVATAAHAPIARSVGGVLAQNEHFLLVSAGTVHSPD